MKEFKDRVAVVTGAGSGIGKALARRFAAEGMKVALADVEADALTATEDELRASGAAVLAVRTDVSKAAAVEALAARTVEAFGGVHLLCNNAGVGVGGISWQQTNGDWEWVLGVNLWGVIHGIRAFLPRMVKQGAEGHIVNTASGAGLHTRPWLAMYCASKHAVVALSECLHHELALTGSKIKVSVLCPAVVRTRIGESERNRPAELANQAASGAAVMEAMERAFRQALASGMDPDEVAERVLEAVRSETFYIITHPETRERVRARLDDILEGRPPGLVA